MKQKTHSGVKKRVKITGSGKIMRRKSCKNHLMSSKNKRQLKSFEGGVCIPKGHRQTFSRLLNIS